VQEIKEIRPHFCNHFFCTGRTVPLMSQHFLNIIPHPRSHQFYVSDLWHRKKSVDVSIRFRPPFPFISVPCSHCISPPFQPMSLIAHYQFHKSWPTHHSRFLHFLSAVTVASSLLSKSIATAHNNHKKHLQEFV